MSCWGGNLSPHFVWVWGLGFTQTHISAFLLFGPWGYQETNYRGHLEQRAYFKAQVHRVRKGSNSNTIHSFIMSRPQMSMEKRGGNFILLNQINLSCLSLKFSYTYVIREWTNCSSLLHLASTGAPKRTSSLHRASATYKHFIIQLMHQYTIRRYN